MPDVAGKAVRLRSVCVAYKAVDVVHDVDIEINPGEAIALLGANGSGKSSIVKALTGVVAPSSGEVWLGDTDVTGRSVGEICRLGVAVVPEGRRIFPDQTVVDNLRVAAWPSRCNRRELASRVERVFVAFPLLGERQRSQAGGLSGGQAQMLSIAMALMSDPSVLVLDEPSLGLAPVMVDAVMDEIARLRDEGRTILVADENSDSALAVTSRAYVLRNGRVVLHSDCAALTTDTAQLHEAYLGA